LNIEQGKLNIEQGTRNVEYRMEWRIVSRKGAKFKTQGAKECFGFNQLQQSHFAPLLP
jgi:hypothetical protein